jgi:hypothetical protein
MEQVANCPAIRQTKRMRWTPSLLLVSILLISAGPAASAAPPGGKHRLTEGQAKQMVLLVAKHDRIDLSDTHIEVNSMDVNAAFIPGFSSFIVIRESTTPGPDQTLRRYAVNRNTGDVWELTLCTHYSFAALQCMRIQFSGLKPTEPAELAAESRQLGCDDHRHVPTQ